MLLIGAFPADFRLRLREGSERSLVNLILRSVFPSDFNPYSELWLSSQRTGRRVFVLNQAIGSHPQGSTDFCDLHRSQQDALVAGFSLQALR